MSIRLNAGVADCNHNATAHAIVVRLSAPGAASHNPAALDLRPHTFRTLDIVPAGDEPPTHLRHADYDTLTLEIDTTLLQEAAREVRAVDAPVGLQARTKLLDPTLADLCTSLYLFAQDHVGAAPPSEIGALAKAALHYVASHYCTPLNNVAGKQTLSASQARRTRDYIEQNIAERLLLADVARNVSLSASHFRSLFRRTFGVSVHRYIVNRRVALAVERLRKGGSSLSEVAVDVGFSHQSHLARWMRRISGSTPSAIARAHASAAGGGVENDAPRV